jgi:hypothetical protein
VEDGPQRLGRWAPGLALRGSRRPASSSPSDELKDPVRERLRRYGIEEAIGADGFFPTIGVAVAAYLEGTGTEWLDWEDRASRPSGPQRR